MARATKDGTRRREHAGRRAAGREITVTQAVRIARRHGLDVGAARVRRGCRDMEFEASPSIPPSETVHYDGWYWVIDRRDFVSWCEWEAARRGC